MKLYNVSRFYDSNFLVIISVLCCLIVMCVCAAIDYLRIKFIEKPLFIMLTPILDVQQVRLANNIRWFIRKTKYSFFSGCVALIYNSIRGTWLALLHVIMFVFLYYISRKSYIAIL